MHRKSVLLLVSWKATESSGFYLNGFSSKNREKKVRVKATKTSCSCWDVDSRRMMSHSRRVVFAKEWWSWLMMLPCRADSQVGKRNNTNMCDYAKRIEYYLWSQLGADLAIMKSLNEASRCLLINISETSLKFPRASFRISNEDLTFDPFRYARLITFSEHSLLSVCVGPA